MSSKLSALESQVSVAKLAIADWCVQGAASLSSVDCLGFAMIQTTPAYPTSSKRHANPEVGD